MSLQLLLDPIDQTSVKPNHYHVSLFDLQLGSSWAYNGVVKIAAKVNRPTSEIVLNVNEIEIKNALVTAEDGSQLGKASDITYDKKSERVAVKFPGEISAPSVHLTINFKGTMNNAMAGFYRSKYKPVVEPAADTPKEGDFHYMLSTQFESCDARRAFPCFDEPNLKSTFDFEIEVPKGQTAISNMPVASERDGSHSGLKFVSFERTPVMSTYVSSLTWSYA